MAAPLEEGEPSSAELLAVEEAKRDGKNTVRSRTDVARRVQAAATPRADESVDETL